MSETIETSPPASQRRFIPLTEWPKHHSWPPIGGLRHLVFYADENGFDKVIRRAGRRVLIDEQAFFQWLDEQNGGRK
ncbi:MAG: hypothetical protein ACTHOO_12045 [Alcanivorax sp.]